MYCIIFALCLASVACNDIRLGYPSAQSRKIISEIKEANPALWTRTDDIIVNAPNNELISAVYVTDLREDKDGEAYIESGGIGTKSVTIGLKSPSILRGYRFEVEVFGSDANARYLTKGTYNENYYDGQYSRNSMGLLEFEQWSNQPDLFTDRSRLCSKLSLTPGQRRVCRRHKEHMPVVSTGVRNGINECQHQFSGRRWNCTVSEDGTVFGPLSFIASRETAFTYAITAAGVSLSISRACRDGRLSSCSCSRASRPKHLHNEWVWGGCGDNLEYGYKFTESFVDVRERERKVKRGSREQGRQLMNRHNNEAGRRAVIVKSKVTCKCHGVSGSCSLITCWNQLASFREVGDYLKDKYDGATEVMVSRRGKLRISNPRYSLPTAQDLVYLEDSPNFCVKNESVGSQGTTGRECNRTSSDMEGCSLMCCGRGYNTKRTVARERCNCKFHWCCQVDCDTCVKSVEVYTCK